MSEEDIVVASVTAAAAEGGTMDENIRSKGKEKTSESQKSEILENETDRNHKDVSLESDVKVAESTCDQNNEKDKKEDDEVNGADDEIKDNEDEHEKNENENNAEDYKKDQKEGSKDKKEDNKEKDDGMTDGEDERKKQFKSQLSNMIIVPPSQNQVTDDATPEGDIKDEKEGETSKVKEDCEEEMKDANDEKIGNHKKGKDSDMFLKGFFSKGKDHPDQPHGSNEQQPSPSKKPGFQLFRSVRKAYNKMKKGGNSRPSSSPMPKILEGLDEDLEPAAVVIDVRKGRTRGPQGRKRLSHRPFSTVSLDIDLVAESQCEEVPKSVSIDNELPVDNSDGARAVAPSGESGGKDSD